MFSMSLLPRTSPKPKVISTTQVSISDCSTFRIMCDVPSTVVICRESTQGFPVTV